MSTRAPDIVIVDHDLEALRTLVAPLRKQFEFYLTVSANEAELAGAELFYVLKRPCTADQLKEVLEAAARAHQVQGDGGTGEHIVLESDSGPEPAHAEAPSTNDPITVL